MAYREICAFREDFAAEIVAVKQGIDKLVDKIAWGLDQD